MTANALLHRSVERLRRDDSAWAARQIEKEFPSVNNSDLADALAAANGITKADARKYVDGILAAIADAATKGEEIALNGFGKFKVSAT